MYLYIHFLYRKYIILYFLLYKNNILKIENLNFKTTNRILAHEMTSNENFVNIKVVELIKMYNLYFGHLFI